ncbi:hypothetical protein F5887DRAFT_888031 [Amanita rubescens]|nr:hypothetical protein F5887DRAFT_888031 [Amanita rubescens]
MACTGTASITYTDRLKPSDDTLSPQPFVIFVSVNGSLPPELRVDNIPFQVTVSIPVKYARYMTPVLRAGPINNDDSDDVDDSDSADFSTNSDRDNVPITFLPLPSTFNHRDTASWAILVNQISMWLVDTVRSPRYQEWGWGVEAFWMAFIAAYPSFPDGVWPSWDTTIGADTRFFQQWLESGGRAGWCHQNDIRDDCLLAFLDKIWSLFCQHTSLFYPSILL